MLNSLCRSSLIRFIISLGDTAAAAPEPDFWILTRLFFPMVLNWLPTNTLSISISTLQSCDSGRNSEEGQNETKWQFSGTSRGSVAAADGANVLVEDCKLIRSSGENRLLVCN